MDRINKADRVKGLAEIIVNEIRALPEKNTPNIRTVRKKYSQQIRRAEPEFVLALAREIVRSYGYRTVPYELIANHKAAFLSLDEAILEELGQGIDSWGAVDIFARTLSGPAWLHKLVEDELFARWACSDDFWWRRAALVSTVALNLRSQGGYGDILRTFSICRLLVSDHEDMVVKAMSWALRELVVHDPRAVRNFLEEHDRELASRVKREVNNKINTGLKYPKGKQSEE